MGDNLEDIEQAENRLANKIRKEKIEIAILEKDNQEKQLRTLKFYLYIQIAIIIAALLLMYKRYPEVSAALTPQRILRYGTYETDAKTDECISNIWKLMGNKKLKLHCPVSGKEYIIDGDEIYCPDASVHGFKKIYSSKGQIPRVE